VSFLARRYEANCPLPATRMMAGATGTVNGAFDPAGIAHPDIIVRPAWPGLRGRYGMERAAWIRTDPLGALPAPLHGRVAGGARRRLCRPLCCLPAGRTLQRERLPLPMWPAAAGVVVEDARLLQPHRSHPPCRASRHPGRLPRAERPRRRERFASAGWQDRMRSSDHLAPWLLPASA